MFYGHGAGGDATASAVVANLVEAINFDQGIDKTNQKISESIGTQNKKIKKIDEIETPFYLRIHAEDVSGVMAEITNILALEKISIEAVTQHEPTDTDSLIPIVMITNSMQKTIDETNRRRKAQEVYNKSHSITPQPLQKKNDSILLTSAGKIRIIN